MPVKRKKPRTANMGVFILTQDSFTSAQTRTNMDPNLLQALITCQHRILFEV